MYRDVFGGFWLGWACWLGDYRLVERSNSGSIGGSYQNNSTWLLNLPVSIIHSSFLLLLPPSSLTDNLTLPFSPSSRQPYSPPPTTPRFSSPSPPPFLLLLLFLVLRLSLPLPRQRQRRRTFIRNSRPPFRCSTTATLYHRSEP